MGRKAGGRPGLANSGLHSQKELLAGKKVISDLQTFARMFAFADTAGGIDGLTFDEVRVPFKLEVPDVNRSIDSRTQFCNMLPEGLRAKFSIDKFGRPEPARFVAAARAWFGAAVRASRSPDLWIADRSRGAP